MNPASIQINALPAVPGRNSSNLPKESGIYFVCDASNKVYYIGLSKNINQRWHTHHRRLDFRKIRGCQVRYVSISDFSALPALEAELIKIYDPPLNIRSRSKESIMAQNVEWLSKENAKLVKELRARLAFAFISSAFVPFPIKLVLDGYFLSTVEEEIRSFESSKILSRGKVGKYEILVVRAELFNLPNPALPHGTVDIWVRPESFNWKNFLCDAAYHESSYLVNPGQMKAVEISGLHPDKSALPSFYNYFWWLLEIPKDSCDWKTIFPHREAAIYFQDDAYDLGEIEDLDIVFSYYKSR